MRSPNPNAIIYLASIDFPHVKARAIQIVSTCHALARAGRPVTLVVGRRESGTVSEHLARFGLAPHPNLSIVGVPAFRLPLGAPALLQRGYTRFWNWTYLTASLALLPILLRRAGGPLMARDYRLAWLLLKSRPWHRRRLIFEVHGLPSAELLDQAEPTAAVRREAARRRRLEEAVFAGAWRLLSITDCLRERLVSDYSVPKERLFTVPDASGAPLSTVQQATATSTPTSASRGALRRLIYVGQLYPWKGVDVLIQALPDMPRAELTLVGGLEGDPRRAHLERLARQIGVTDRVHFSGPVPYASVPAILSRYEVALLPLADGLVARCFTSPLKLFDYLAAGLPIVAADFPTIREVLRDGQNGLLVAPGDPAALAAAVNRLLDDPHLAGRLAAQARADADEYTWDRRAQHIIAALGEEGAARTPVGAAES